MSRKQWHHIMEPEESRLVMATTKSGAIEDAGSDELFDVSMENFIIDLISLT